jgi:hypothetical protein
MTLWMDPPLLSPDQSTSSSATDGSTAHSWQGKAEHWSFCTLDVTMSRGGYRQKNHIAIYCDI